MNIVWFRRNLRLEDNIPLQKAIAQGGGVLPIFIFDTNILARFAGPSDRRVNFIASALFEMHQQLKAFGGGMTILHGDPKLILPKLIADLKAIGQNPQGVYADEDFEPTNIERDKNVAQNLDVPLNLSCDHLLLRPGLVLTEAGTPFKVFTPFSKAFGLKLLEEKPATAVCDLNKIAIYNLEQNLPDVKIVRFSSVADILQGIGYNYVEEPLWKQGMQGKILEDFCRNKISTYQEDRNFMSSAGTSALSPYIRFGLISIRRCFLEGYDKPNSQMWISELLWREFYANILFHFPHTHNTEFLPQYVGTLPWSQDPKLLEALETGSTGYPIVDSSIRQLIQDGWMHNRSRMIVASFTSKNMMLDWRLGEGLFAKYLMDYDLASNVGGWQWASSCGTDAQPYFRIFNPLLQSQRFDANGQYVKRYIPELESVSTAHIHDGDLIRKFYPQINYPPAIVDYHSSRAHALKVFSLKS